MNDTFRNLKYKYYCILSSYYKLNNRDDNTANNNFYCISQTPKKKKMFFHFFLTIPIIFLTARINKAIRYNKTYHYFKQALIIITSEKSRTNFFLWAIQIITQDGRHFFCFFAKKKKKKICKSWRNRHKNFVSTLGIFRRGCMLMKAFLNN